MIDMNYLKLLVFVVVLLKTNAVQLPSYFSQCALSDPNLGNCIKDSGNKGLSTYIQGDEKIHVPNLNPLFVDNMYIDVDQGLKINLTKCNIYGLDTARLENVNWDVEAKHAKLEVHIDYTSLISDYDIAGKILILPITGVGPCNITFEDPTFDFSFDFELEPKKNKEYLKILNSKLTYKTKRAYFKLYNLFGGNKDLADNMLKFLDENWEAVNGEIGARVGDALALVFSNILQNMFYRIPYNLLFAE